MYVYIVLAVLFIVLASPATYKLTSGVLGSWIASSAGCATQTGALVHAAVFAAVALAIGALLKGRTETYKQPGTRWHYKECTGPKSCYVDQLVSKHYTSKSKTDGQYYQLFWSMGAQKYKWLSSRQQSTLQSLGY